MPTAFVLIRCEEGAEKRIMRKYNGKNSVSEIQPTVGHYDFVAKIASPDVDRLDEIIEEIHCNDKVRLTNVLRLSEPVETA